MRIALSGFNVNFIAGANLYPRKIGMGFLKAGHRILILSSAIPKTLYPEEKISSYLRINIINSLFIYRKTKKFNPDVVIINGFSFADLFLYYYSKHLNKPAFFVVHNKVRQILEDQISMKLLIDILEKLYIQMLNSMSLIFVLNQDMDEYIKSLGMNNTKLIDNPVDLSVFHPAEKFEVPGKESEWHLICVANINKRKNQKYLLEVIKHLPGNFYLHFVGGYTLNVGYYAEFRTQLLKENSENIIYHGKKNINEISELLRGSHIYVTSSLLEGKSFSQIEALATGLPTVRLYSNQTAGITSHNYTAIHIPVDSDPKIFAEAIEKLSKSPKEYLRLRTNSIKESEKYSQKQVAREIVALIERATTG